MLQGWGVWSWTGATTIFGAVSSAVERLVYTERVGGSIPSPPIPPSIVRVKAR